MKIKTKTGQIGILKMKDGTTKNYGAIRITRNNTKLIHYTGKGLREMFKPDMTPEEKIKAEELKQQDEKMLIKGKYIAETPFSEINEIIEDQQQKYEL